MRQTLTGWAATSCFLILAVIVLRRAFGKRMGAGLRYALWGLVLVRLLVPVQLFTSPVLGTVMLSEERYTRIERETPDTPGGQDGPQAAVTAAPVSPGPAAFPEAPEPPGPPAAPDLTKAPAWLGWLWLCGSIVMAVVLAGCNLSFSLRLRRTRAAHMSQQMQLEAGSAPLGGPGRRVSRVPVYIVEGLPSPCLFGVFRPAVYVAPETAADPDALRHVLAHEHTHYRHGDHIWSLLRCAALALHWWNPLVWLAAKLSRRDGELACDEGALKRLGDGERAAYGATLLALVAAKPAPGGLLTCSTAMTGDKKSLAERFARIARAPKRWLWAAVAAALLAVLVTVCAFGQKTEEGDFLEGISADLSCSIDGDDKVIITGTVDGLELHRGTFWYPGSLFSGCPYGVLYLNYPDFSDGIVGCLSAHWTGESHTAVSLSTRPMAMVSSYWPSGYWEFIVDFSGGEAVAARMDAIAVFPEDLEVLMHPETISEEDAVRAGRIAARLLTAAEACWEEGKEGEASVTPAPSQTSAPSAEEAPKWYVRQLLGDMLDCDDWAVEFWSSPGSEPVRADMDAAGYGEEIKKLFDALEWVKVNECPNDLEPDGGYVVELSAARGSLRCRRGSDFLRMDDAGTELYFQAEGAGALWEALADLWPGAELAEDSGEKTPFVYVETAFRYTGNDPLSGFAVPRDVRDAAKALAAEQFRAVAPDGWVRTWGFAHDKETGKDVPIPLEEPVEFDRVRLKNMDGPYVETVQTDGGDVYVELWKLAYEFHAVEPERAKILLAGGMTLDEEGWMDFRGPNYLAFTGEGEERTATPFRTASELNTPQFRGELARALPQPILSSVRMDPFQARRELRQVLLGETAFTFYGEEGKAVSLDIGAAPRTVFPLTGAYGEIWSFAVIDLDGDGAEEAVLHIGGVAGDAGGFLVLHWAGPGDVRGYPSYWRNFWNLKTDGTFYYDYYMGITGIAWVSFPAPGYAMEQHAIMEGREDMSVYTDPPTGTFTVDGEAVTCEEYLAALDKQDEKPDAAWFDFTEENIRQLFVVSG